MNKTILSVVPALIIGVSTCAFAGGSGNHDHESEFSVGEPAKGKVDRTIVVSMQDSMRFVFDPPLSDLHAGEVIAFQVKNDGRIQHEFSIGNAKDQVEHAEMMREMPGMKHRDPNTVSLKPGDTATLKWRFKGDDTVVFACNIPGHYEAGMHHDVTIKGSGHSHFSLLPYKHALPNVTYFIEDNSGEKWPPRQRLARLVH